MEEKTNKKVLKPSKLNNKKVLRALYSAKILSYYAGEKS